MLLKIYFMDDFALEVTDEPKAYRLVDELPLAELGSTINEAAAELVVLTRAPRWYDLDGGRRPIRVGDVIVFGTRSYRYMRCRGGRLPGGCNFRLEPLEGKFL